VCVCVCVWCVCVSVRARLSDRDYVMECALGLVESRSVRRVGCSLLWTVLWLVYYVGGIFLCKKIPNR